MGATSTGAMLAPWPIPEGLRIVAIEGYPLAYRDEGAGAPVVLVHGSLSDYRSWSDQIGWYARHYRVLVPCLRHYHPERWDGVGDDFSVAQHADDIAAFVARMAQGRAHLIGHSRGGAVALTLARRYPQLVRSLTLADPRGLESLLPETPEARAMAIELAASFATLKRNLAAGDVDRGAREFVDALAGPGAWDRRAPELKQMFIDNIATAADSGEAPPVTCDDIQRLPMPLLLVTGEHSPKRYGEMFAAMRACRMAIAPPVVIPRAAHAMQRDNAQAFNAITLEFLASCGSA